jgi:predicted transcriptional regulator
MREKISNEEKDRRFRRASQFLDQVLEDPDSFPDRAVVFLWSDEELGSLFTRERLKLLRKVKEKAYGSITELARELGRDGSVVRKDLKLLEEYGLVKMEKQGTRVKIYSDKEGIYIPLAEAKPVEKHVEEVLQQ